MSEVLKRIAADLRALPARFAANRRKAAETGVLVYDVERNCVVREDASHFLKQKRTRVVPLNPPRRLQVPGLPPEQWPLVSTEIIQEPAWKEHELEMLAELDQVGLYEAQAGKLLAAAVAHGAFTQSPDLFKMIRDTESISENEERVIHERKDGAVDPLYQGIFVSACESFLWPRFPEIRSSRTPRHNQLAFEQSCERFAELIWPDQELAPRQHPDGPELPDGFWQKGQRFDIEPVPCKLLHYLWNKGKAQVADVERAVWGDEQENDNKLDVAKSKANSLMCEAGCPKQLRRAKGWIILT